MTISCCFFLCSVNPLYFIFVFILVPFHFSIFFFNICLVAVTIVVVVVVVVVVVYLLPFTVLNIGGRVIKYRKASYSAKYQGKI